MTSLLNAVTTDPIEPTPDALFERIGAVIKPLGSNAILIQSTLDAPDSLELIFIGKNGRKLDPFYHTIPNELFPTVRDDINALVALVSEGDVGGGISNEQRLAAPFLTTSIDLVNKTVSSSFSSIQPDAGTPSPVNAADELLRLKRLGVHEITAHYSGSNDSGEISQFIAKDSHGEDITDRVGSSDDSFSLESAVYELLEATAGGWEIDDGSNGELHFNLETGRLDVSHNTYAVTPINTETKINLKTLELPAKESEAIARVSPFFTDKPIMVSYSGADGDSDGFTAWTLETAPDGTPRRSYLGAIDERAISDVGYALLEKLHPNWVDQSGASGEFSIDLRTGHIDLTHTAYFVGHEHKELNETLLVVNHYGFEQDHFLVDYVVLCVINGDDLIAYCCQAESAIHARNQAVINHSEGEGGIDILWIEQADESELEAVFDSFYEHERVTHRAIPIRTP